MKRPIGTKKRKPRRRRSDVKTLPFGRPWNQFHVATYLNVDSRTVIAWAKTGKLPGKRVTKQTWLFDSAEIMDRFMPSMSE